MYVRVRVRVVMTYVFDVFLYSIVVAYNCGINCWYYTRSILVNVDLFGI